jgi:hypothetical protein
LVLASEDRLGAEAMLALHWATAAATAEFAVEPPELPVLVDPAWLLVAEAGAAAELDDELLLLLLPQPATSAPPTAAIAAAEHSLLIMGSPIG